VWSCAPRKHYRKCLSTEILSTSENHIGRSSEKNPNQDDIFSEAELAACAIDVIDSETEEAVIPKDKIAAKKRGRKGFSENIPREQIYVDLSAMSQMKSPTC